MFVCDGYEKLTLFPYGTEYAEASTFFGTFATLRRATVCCVMSVRPSILWEEHGIIHEELFSIDLDGPHSYFNV
jgi:hypothetical protein